MKFFKNKKNTIKLTILKFGFVAVFAVAMLSSRAMAATVTCSDGSVVTPPAVCPSGQAGGGPSGQATGSTNTVTIANPLGDNIKDIPSFIKVLVTIVLIIGIPIVALAIIYSGFLFVTAQGNSEKLTKAKKALLYSLIGGALLLGAFVIADAIGKTVDEIKSTT